MTRVPDDHVAARALQREFERLGEERAAERRRGMGRSRQSLRTGAVSAGIVLGLAAVAAGTSSLVGDGEMTSQDPQPLPPRLERAPADRRLSPVRVPDPDGGLPWGAQTYTSAAGFPCALVGRVKDERLGSVQGQAFRPFSERAAGACVTRGDQHLAVVLREFVEPARRVVVHGVADRTVSFVGLARGGRTEEIPIAPDGVFLYVVAGGRHRLAGTALVTRVGRRERRTRLVR